MKTVVITGVSRGIGLAISKKFLAEGWRVIGTYSKTPIPISSPDLISIKMDQGSRESIENATEEIKKSTSNIDALINNAGIILDAVDSSIDIEKIKQTFEVDLFGVVDVTEKLLPLMSVGSHIVNIDSQYGSFSFPIDDTTSTGYRLAKAALNMYTRILAFRLKSKKIVVSSLDPGWVKTDMGIQAATELEKPDREPEEPAEDIYNLVTNVNDISESGYFWRFGQKREW